MEHALLRVLPTKLLTWQPLLVTKKRFILVYPKQHLKFAIVTERNTHNKVESINMSRLQLKQKTMYLMPK